jgi:hypothetical protein
MKLLPMSQGDVLIYDHRLLHCSAVNLGLASRPGAVMGLVPAESELKHYFAEGDRVRQYRSDVEFLMSGRTHLAPDSLCPEGLVDHDATPISAEQLERMLTASEPSVQDDVQVPDRMQRMKEFAP